jgi:hypothetical protein
MIHGFCRYKLFLLDDFSSLQYIIFLGLDDFNICNFGIRQFQYFELDDF